MGNQTDNDNLAISCCCTNFGLIRVLLGLSLQFVFHFIIALAYALTDLQFTIYEITSLHNYC